MGSDGNNVHWTERWLSPARFAPYLAVCDTKAAALDLYRWNIGLAQAVLSDIAVFEIALRNSYDARISASFKGSQHWIFDESSPVRKPIMRKNARGRENDMNLINRKLIDKAIERKGLDADGVISELTLGFWVHLTDRSHERDSWIPYVHKRMAERHKSRHAPQKTACCKRNSQ